MAEKREEEISNGIMTVPFSLGSGLPPTHPTQTPPMQRKRRKREREERAEDRGGEPFLSQSVERPSLARTEVFAEGERKIFYGARGKEKQGGLYRGERKERVGGDSILGERSTAEGGRDIKRDSPLGLETRDLASAASGRQKAEKRRREGPPCMSPPTKEECDPETLSVVMQSRGDRSWPSKVSKKDEVNK